MSDSKTLLAKIDKGVRETKDGYKELKKQVEELQDKVLAKNRVTEFIPGLADEIEKRAKKPSLIQVVRGIKWGEWGDGFEQEILKESAKKYEKLTGRRPGTIDRDMGTESDTGGGYLVPPELMGELIERLKAKAVAIQAGARLMTGFTESPVLFPRLDSSVSVNWTNEGGDLTASDAAVGQIRFEPKRLGALAKLSQRLIRQAVPDADRVIEEDMASELALELDRVIYFGTGAAGEPLGLKFISGINTSDFNGAELTFKNVLVDLIGPSQDANAEVDDASAGVITHPGAIRKLQVEQVDSGGGAGTGAYAYAPIMSIPELNARAGINFFGSTQFPTDEGDGDETRAFFGPWKELLIAQWFGMTLEASTQAGDAFARSQVWLKMELEVDINVRHPASFTMGTEIDAVDP